MSGLYGFYFYVHVDELGKRTHLCLIYIVNLDSFARLFLLLKKWT